MKKFLETAQLLKELGPLLKEAGPLLNELKPILKEAGPLLKEAAPLIKEGIKEIGPGIKEALDEYGPQVREAIPELIEAIQEERRRRQRENNGEDEVDDDDDNNYQRPMQPVEYGTGRLFGQQNDTYDDDLQRALDLSRQMSENQDNEIKKEPGPYGIQRTQPSTNDSFDNDLQRVLELSKRTADPNNKFSPYDDDDNDLQRALELSKQVQKEEQQINEVVQRSVNTNRLAIDPLTGRIMSQPGPKKEEEDNSEKGEEKMESLQMMGFSDKTKNRMALEMFNYDLQRAVNYLMM